eukprot:m.156500 g.156500  ORF g.156500 m.156500 type:complete len:90 (+) comp17938_c0_seq3:3397-3666(+)
MSICGGCASSACILIGKKSRLPASCGVNQELTVRSHHVQYDHLLLFFSAAPSASSLFHVFVSLEKSDEPALEDTPLAALPAVSTLPRAA